MKQRMKLGTITAVVVVGLMIASAFTSAAVRTTTSSSLSNGKEQISDMQLNPASPSDSQMQLIEKIITGQMPQLKSTLVKSIDLAQVRATQAGQYALTKVAMVDGIDSQSASSNSADSGDQPLGDRAETFRVEQHPAVADDSAGNFVLMHHLQNDTYPNLNGLRNKWGVLAIYGADNYGQTEADWSDPYIAKYVANYANNGTQPIPWDYPAVSYAGVNETGVERYYGFVQEYNNPYTSQDESGKLTIFRILGDPKNINDASFRYRPWFSLMSSQSQLKMPSIASSPGLRFALNNTHWKFWPNGTFKPYASGGGGGEPFGIIVWLSKDSTHPSWGANMANIGYPCDINDTGTSITPFPPHGRSSNPYIVHSYWHNVTSGAPMANATSTDAAIDAKNKWSYYAFDPRERSTDPRTGGFGWTNNISYQMFCYDTNPGSTTDPLVFDPAAKEGASFWTVSLNNIKWNIWHPTIAGYDGAVVAANELRNNSGSSSHLCIWYNNLYNGSTWGSGSDGTPPNSGFTTVGTWNLSDENPPKAVQVRYPHVYHYEGNTFYMLFIRHYLNPANPDELDLTITYDGGATWGPAEGYIQWWPIAGGTFSQYKPVSEDACLAVGDNTYAWEWTNTSYTPPRTFVLMDYRTGVITGQVKNKFNGLVVSGATVDVYNKDRLVGEYNYPMRLGPVTTDVNGNFKKKCFFGIDLWQGSNMSIIASSNALSSVNITAQISWNPIDYVNTLPDPPGPLMIDVHYRDLTNFPFYWAYGVNTTSLRYEVTDTGAATAQMILNYLWWNQTQDKVMPMTYDDQFALFSQLNTKGGKYIDAKEMMDGLNSKVPSYASYGYHFEIRNRPNTVADRNLVIQSICKWIDYNVSRWNVQYHKNLPKPGFTRYVPIAVPYNGSYENWIIVRGIYTSAGAWDAYPNFPPVTVYGFWVNDPSFNMTNTNLNYYGLPGKTYMTADTFKAKFLPISPTLYPADDYKNQYLAITDPPQGTNVNDDTGTIVYGTTHSEFTPAQMKLSAIFGVLPQKTVAQAAKNAVMKILINDVNNNFVSEFEHAMATKVLKNHDGYKVFFKTSVGQVVVNMLRNGVMSDFTVQ